VNVVSRAPCASWLVARIASVGGRQQCRGLFAIGRKKAPAPLETRVVAHVKLEPHEFGRLEVPQLVDRTVRGRAAILHDEHRPIGPVARLLECRPGLGSDE